MKYLLPRFMQMIYVASLLLFIACREPLEIPVDPCFDAKPFTSNILIKEHVGDSLIITDKVLHYNLVTFEAPLYYQSSYEWKIGDDERVFTTRTVTLRFLPDAIGEIPIRLIAKGYPNTACFPEDNGTDTVEQILHVIAWKDAPIIGNYQGYFDSNPADDQQIVEVKFITPEENIRYEPFGGFELINIDQGCLPYPITHNTKLWFYVHRGTRALEFDASGNYFYNCNAPNAWLSLKGSDTLKVDFTYGQLGTNNRFKDKFTGVRVSQ